MVKRLGSAYDSPKHVSLIITNSWYGSNVFRAPLDTLFMTRTLKKLDKLSVCLYLNEKYMCSLKNVASIYAWVWKPRPTHLYSIISAAEVDEGKPTGPACLMVVHHLHLFNGTVLPKDITQIFLLSVQTQAKDAQTTTRLRVILQMETKCNEFQ